MTLCGPNFTPRGERKGNEKGRGAATDILGGGIGVWRGGEREREGERD